MIRNVYTLPAASFSASLPDPADDLLFFDIETTGLSPKDSSLYLIGCMYKNGDDAELVQLLCENCSEEADLINEFLKIQKLHPKLVHYNGSTFDVPFIKAKAAQFNIPFPEEINELDIYKKLKPFKKILGLSSMRLKAVESFLNLTRRDMFDGGELIDIYLKYVARRSIDLMTGNIQRVDSEALPGGTVCHETASDFSKTSGLRLMGNTSSQDLLRILLLHNYEDVYNLAPIASLLALPTFFEGDFTAAGCEISDDGQSLLLKLTPGYEAVTDLILRSFHLSASLEGSFSSPVKINVPGGVQFEISLCVSDRDLLIRIPVYRRELKLFLPDYKNYYYLPAEDYCVHKSLGSLLSADAAVKCTAATCYTKKEGNFVPSSAKKGGNIAKLTYLYQTGYKDTCRYLPAEVLQEDGVVQKEYVLDILHALL